MAEIGIFVGTMYGNALLVAEEAEAILTAQGHKATVFEDPDKGIFPTALCRCFRGLKIILVSSQICVTA